MTSNIQSLPDDLSIDSFLMRVARHYNARPLPQTKPHVFDAHEVYYSCLSGEAEEQARALVDAKLKNYARSTTKHFTSCASVYCGKLSIPLGLISLSLDMRSGNLDSIELGLGKGFTGSFGWNFKRSESILGFGYGANLDKIIKMGGVIKYSPSKGLIGTVDFGPGGIPVISPGKDAKTSVSIAKFSGFMN